MRPRDLEVVFGVMGKEMKNEDLKDNPLIQTLIDGGHEFLEKPYSDNSPIKKYWAKGFWFEKEWGLSIDLSFFEHSKNWSEGSLNFDIFFFSVVIGPFDMYIARRVTIFPPKGWGNGK